MATEKTSGFGTFFCMSGRYHVRIQPVDATRLRLRSSEGYCIDQLNPKPDVAVHAFADRKAIYWAEATFE